MFAEKCLIVFVATFELISAQLLSCSLENDHPKVCFKGENNYAADAHFPLVLNTTLKLKEIVDIDENEKSISIQMSLVTEYKASGLDRSKGTMQ